MSERSENFAEDSAAFQKIWLESMSRLMKAAASFTPESVPPELLRQIRSGVFQALAESWNEFLRSPQFQQGMKEWLDRAIAFRKLSNEFLAKARKEMQAPSRDDIDAVMLAVRQMETRVLDRVEELARQVQQLDGRHGGVPPPKAPSPPKRQPRNAARPRKGKKP